MKLISFSASNVWQVERAIASLQNTYTQLGVELQTCDDPTAQNKLLRQAALLQRLITVLHYQVKEHFYAEKN